MSAPIWSLSGQAGVVRSIFSATNVPSTRISSTISRLTMSRCSSGSWTCRRASVMAVSLSMLISYLRAVDWPRGPRNGRFTRANQTRPVGCSRSWSSRGILARRLARSPRMDCSRQRARCDSLRKSSGPGHSARGRSTSPRLPHLDELAGDACDPAPGDAGKSNTADRIRATLDDYAVIRGLVFDLMGSAMETNVSEAVRETVEAVRVLTLRTDSTVTVTQVARHLHVDVSTASRRVKVAVLSYPDRSIYH